MPRPAVDAVKRLINISLYVAHSVYTLTGTERSWRNAAAW